MKGMEKTSFYKINEQFDIYLHNPAKYEEQLTGNSLYKPFAKLYKKYNEVKLEQNSLDFNDLLV
jgi:superfamily I DNA/RNA helicase